MDYPKVGLLTFGDIRPDMWENYFRERVEPLHAQAIAFFEKQPITLTAFPEVSRTRELVDRQVAALKAAGVEAVIVHTPAWIFANEIVRAVQSLGVPVVLVGNKMMSTMSSVAFLAAGGALGEVDYPHYRILDNFDGADGEDLAQRSLPIFRAAATAARLRGQVFGLIGGRSLGMDTGTLDPGQWKKLFGVDVEHIDQLEIIRRVPLIAPTRVEQMAGWMESLFCRIEYNDAGLTHEKLDYQIRCFLATKDIIHDFHLDFVGIKCMPDLATHYVPQCLTAALLPGPYDAEGPRPPIMMSCEADANGGLTMQMLHLVSGGAPALFMDVGYLNFASKTLYLGNCGAMSTWFAHRSDDPAENLKDVCLRPSIRPGGGASTTFTCGAGPLTLARLYRKAGRYFMAIIQGETVTLSQTELDEFARSRGKHQLPMAYVKVSMDLNAFLEEFGSNHINGVAGCYERELVYLCELLGIAPIVMK